MLLDSMHPEDVKAAIRKRHGSITAFIKLKGLPVSGVADIFRGRTSQPVRDAIEAVLQESAESIILDCNADVTPAHRLIAGAR